jgi:2-oxoglutarate ferredoxin oxidoreductase subunit beta
MSTTPNPPAPGSSSPATSSGSTSAKTNRIGLSVLDYRGGKTTLCAGCGHNAISERIIDAFFEMGIEPENVAKVSGIGCSSKSPAYFMGRSHSFNAVHGRMPAIATGAAVANHKLMYIGVSGDGDTASIGMGQFAHLMRRNIPMIYIIENNGVYGLTKGQFSATADLGSTLKSGKVNELPGIDTCVLAIELGATFVARSFSGDKRQLLALLKAAIAHNGTVLLDVISPCVTFNDHEGSTRSYKFMKDHEEPLQDINFVPSFEEIDVEYEPGSGVEIEMHDGSKLRLTKLEEDFDPTNRTESLQRLAEAREHNETLTGLFFLAENQPSFTDQLRLVDQPLGTLPQEMTRPPKSVLDEIMEEYR